MDNRFEKIKQIVEKELSCSAHNLDHVLRVHKLCLLLSKTEQHVDMNILIPSALLHDIAKLKEILDKTGQIDHAILGSKLSEIILRDLKFSDIQISKIKHCISTHRFRSNNQPQSIEAKILFDADKLDSIGSIGVARSFMLAGQFGQSVFKNDDKKEYLSNNTSVNGRLKDASKHSPLIEYEVKFKKIPEKLYTKKAREIGIKRLNYMKSFFERLQMEVDGIL